MQTLDLGDHTALIYVNGPEDGPCVMFANSLGTDLRVWDQLVPLLPQSWRVVRYDKRGHGLSDCPNGPYKIETLAQDAAAIADGLGLRDITFVGLSIGGLIGQELALVRPDLLKSLVLMDTAAKIGTPTLWQDRIAALRQDGLLAMSDAILMRWFTPAYQNQPALLAPWRNMVARTPLEGYLACCHALAEADLTHRIGALRLPILALVGAQDLATTPALVRATAAICSADYHEIQGAGHLPCVEAPQETARLIVQFVKEQHHA